MALLEIDSVNFSYGTHKILSDIYLNVNQGEVVGFLGRNGCGKSTLLKVIFGSIGGEHQSVRIDGIYNSASFKSGQVKFLPQDGLFPKFLTPRKAIALYESELAEQEVIEELNDLLDIKFGQLSSGIAKYIETLILLYTPSDFLLMDEPFSFIAPVYVEKLIPQIKEVANQKGILLTDHQYESILLVSDRLYLMSNQAIHPIMGREELKDFGYIN